MKASVAGDTTSCPKMQLDTTPISDEILFKQPESNYYGDCPICFLPRPLDDSKSMRTPCCLKFICQGCVYHNALRQRTEKLDAKCIFCRVVHDGSRGKDVVMKKYKKRAEANDSFGLSQVAQDHYNKGEFKSALKYNEMAAALGDADALFELSKMYRKGQGVEQNDEMEKFYLVKAAVVGHPHARFNLGIFEYRNWMFDRAAKHLIIAANQGLDAAIPALKNGFTNGWVSKEDFAAALRGHKAAVDETKSPQREEADKLMRKLRIDGILP